MTFSILVPYSARLTAFHNTLVSYDHHYRKRRDWEVIVIEDHTNRHNEEEHAKILEEVSKWDFPITLIDAPTPGTFNPSEQFNLGATKAQGEFLVLTNPECFHMTNILDNLECYFWDKRDAYIVCGCMNVSWDNKPVQKYEDFKYLDGEWYQHTQHRDARLHFCSAMSAESYEAIGGFDERFKVGIGYEDVDFIKRITKSGMEIILDDNLIVLHQEHSRDYQANSEKVEHNRLLCVQNESRGVVDLRDVYNTVYGNSQAYNHNLDYKYTEIVEFVRGEQGKILDAGCGEGWTLKNLLNEGYNVEGVEISDVCYKKYLQELPCKRLSILEHAAENPSYARLYCFDVLEHISPEELQKTIQALADMAPYALIGVANHSDVQYGHELHLIQEGIYFWRGSLARSYNSVELTKEFNGRFYIFDCKVSKGDSK